MILFAMIRGYTPPEMITGITGISDFKQFLCVCVWTVPTLQASA
jgi:hypothetical protein